MTERGPLIDCSWLRRTVAQGFLSTVAQSKKNDQVGLWFLVYNHFTTTIPSFKKKTLLAIPSFKKKKFTTE